MSYARVVVLVLLVVSITPSRTRGDQSSDPPRQPAGTRDLVVLEGCIADRVLRTLSADNADPARVVAEGSSYRMTGSKSILHTLRTEHNGHREEVTGKLRGQDAPAGTIHRKQFGKLSVVVGGKTGTDINAPRVPEMRAFEVMSFRHLEFECP